MHRVIVESPYAGQVDRNVTYARAALRDCLMRGEAPYASHLLYTQPGVLRDDVAEERVHGIDAGFCWRSAAALTCFYVDLGWSHGMRLAKQDCIARGLPFEERTLGWQPSPESEFATRGPGGS